MNHITVCAMPHAGGWHQASWRRPETVGNDIWNPDLWRSIARTAERGKLDALFFADNLSLWPVPEHLRHHTAKVGVWDAVVLASLAAMSTQRIGIVATVHTEYQQPYILARQMACLDHLSRGRIGWNVVTSAGPQDAANIRREGLVSTETRYARATEFVKVARGLWDSWEDDAYLIDQERGVFFDPAKLHSLNHEGDFFNVRGPLNIMRSPQGYPVLAQAGGSGPGKQLAGEIGELIFTPLTGEAGRAYRSDVLQIAERAGRKASSVKVLSQLMPVVGATDEEAERKWTWLQSHLDPDIARGVLEAMLAVDLSQFPLDEPLPDLGKTDRIQGYRDAVMSFTKDGRRPTLRELIRDFRGPGTVVGSPKTIADYMEREVDSGVCDGFALLLQGAPEELNDFVDHVVPELQRRKRFRTEYSNTTFRDMLGLERPANQFAAAGRATAHPRKEIA
jgi:FMN-dependent oxidoreductase (nitrilotriacetate monooxygenase family)